MPPSALRDLAGGARIERGWRRLAPAVGPRRRRAGLVHALVAASLAFGGGTVVGKLAWDRGSPPAAFLTAPASVPEGDEGTPAIRAAGSEMRSYDLPEGRITLAALSTVELDRERTRTRSIGLIQGGALIELHGTRAAAAPQVVVGEARLTLESGSTVHVLRRGSELDVTVQKGRARLVSPGLDEHLAAGSRRVAVPILAAPPAQPNAPPRPKEGRADPRPPWYARYVAGDLDAASVLLPADVAQVLASARTADELMALAELSARAGRKREASLAWERVIERFEHDPLAVLAAEKVAATHPGRALDLALRSGSDALVCHVLPREPDRARAARIAREYLSAHPASDCREALAALAAP